MLFLSSTTVALIATIVSGTNLAMASTTTSAWEESASVSGHDISPTLCQFFSSIPGVTQTDTATMTLPACPSSLLSFSYTIPPPDTQTTPAVSPPGSQDGSTATVCQFYSSLPGLQSPMVPESTMTLPPCPSSLQHVTYTYQGTTEAAAATSPTTTSAAVLGAVTSTAPVAATFTGLAPRHGMDGSVLGGALAVLVAIMGMR